MDLLKRHYRKYMIHIIIITALAVYLVSANYIFCCLIRVDGEARIYDIGIPTETGNIRYNIEFVEKQKIDWKDTIMIRGWGFIEDEDATNCSKYIVLNTNTKEYIFDTYMMTRPDVTRYFETMQLDLNESGFQSNIPLERIPDGIYKIGIIISKKSVDKTSYIRTNTYLVKEGNIVNRTYRVDQKIYS